MTLPKSFKGRTLKATKPKRTIKQRRNKAFKARRTRMA